MKKKSEKTPVLIDRAKLEACFLLTQVGITASKFDQQSGRARRRFSVLDPHFEVIAKLVLQKALAPNSQITLSSLAQVISERAGTPITKGGLHAYLNRHPILKGIAQWK